jgi:tetratricopeptide (TPR) repeat protein
MPGERQETPVNVMPELDTSPAATPLAAGGDPNALVAMHRSIANRLLKEGSPSRAYSELVRATRATPMTGRLASALAGIAIKANAVPSAITLLGQGVDEAEGSERAEIRRVLARLHRKHDDLEAAREQLAVLLAEKPTDRRARMVLNGLLEREERWDELDASLDKETRQAVQAGALRRASRSALRRARLWSERLSHPARAALRYGQAAQYAEQGGDHESAFLLRLLWLRMLHKSNAPDRAIVEAIEASVRAGERVGKADRARQLIAELGIGPRARLTLTELEAPLHDEGKEPTSQGAPLERRNSTQVELMQVAEEAEKHGRKPEVAALLRAAIDEGPDPAALRRLEAHFIARGAWRELAVFYRDAGQQGSKAHRAEWLEKLAELLESELDDPMGAAKAWATVASLTGDPRAVQEQVRLHTSRQDTSSARMALDDGVARAATPKAKADALVARAEESLTRKDVAAARTDFEEALKAAPDHPNALAGLAELPGSDAASLAGRLQKALDAVPRRKSGRGELFRRLARLIDSQVKQPKLAQKAWAEVMFEYTQDEEAGQRLGVLARDSGDDTQLEQVLRSQIEKEPRGSRTRKSRMELVAILENSDRADEALEELRKAVRFEPGHQQAWMKLVDYLEERGLYQEGAWALEHGTTATEDAAERAGLWRRLGKFVREHLNDVAKAETYEKRAEKMERELAEPPPEEPSTNPLVPTVPPPKSAALVAPPKAGSAPQFDFTPTPGRPAAPIADLPEPAAVASAPDSEKVDYEEVAKMLGAIVEPDPPRPPEPVKRGGLPAEVLEMLDELAEASVVTPSEQSPGNPWGAEITEGGAKKPAPEATPPRPPPPMAQQKPTTSGRGVPVRVESSGRGVPAVPKPGAPEKPRVESSGKGVAVPRDISRTQPLQSSGKGVKVPKPSPAKTLTLSQVEPSPASPPGAKQAGQTSGLRSRYPQVPSLPIAADKIAARKPGEAAGEDDEAFEGSLLDRIESSANEDASVEEAMAGDDDFVEVGTSDIELPSQEWDAPAGKLEKTDEPRNTQELPLALGDPEASIPPSFGPSPSAKLTKEREALFERVRGRPLDPDGYRRLAEHFDAASDPSRQSLMLEIARAIEGDPHAAPRTPKLILSNADRAGLRHPRLRGEEGELLTLAGMALCRIYPTRGPAAGTKEEFRVDMGKGAKAAADALLAAVRILGLRAPDVYLSNDNGPPFALVFPSEVRLLVGRLAAKRELPEAELRFFAGRALFTQNPDLLALRTLRKEQLYRALNVLGAVLRGQAMSAEARAVRDGLPPKGWERLKQLYERVGRNLDLAALSEAARHSANRAGLIVAGGVAPALAALRAKKALGSEMMELVRFAGSERYLNVRMRKLGRS